MPRKRNKPKQSKPKRGIKRMIKLVRVTKLTDLAKEIDLCRVVHKITRTRIREREILVEIETLIPKIRNRGKIATQI